MLQILERITLVWVAFVSSISYYITKLISFYHTIFINSAADVIHSFAIFALGVKCDAYPCRLNEFSVLINRLATFYGEYA